MKRTPLKRKTPMKRAGKPLKRTPMPRCRKPIRRCSAKKAAWNDRYSKALAAAKQTQRLLYGDTRCERCLCLSNVDGHHPAGRNGDNIMLFVLVCRPCHDWIHQNPNAARKDGWLRYPSPTTTNRP